MNKAFFLDRDGTLNVDYNYVHTPEEWTWCEDAIQALHWIQDHDFKIFVVTNQSGIIKGKYDESHVTQLHKWVDHQLKEEGIYIDDWYYAPYHPEFNSEKNYPANDRKPGTGMFEKANQKYQIDFNRSYMAGDKISDMKPAVELGMSPLFIRSRHAPNQDQQWLRKHSIPICETLWEGLQRLDQKMG